LRLGILRTGWPPKATQARFGDYPAMFRRLLGEDAYDYATFAVNEGELPKSPAECDAYLITGSAAGVYDGAPWIEAAKTFLRAAKGQAALVGVCFGHQLMADAFGGEVIKSPKGWGIGEHEYRILKREPWMDGVQSFRLPASHQDQVVIPPPGAEVIAGSAFTHVAALAYRDQPAISLQPHPEFEPGYAKALIESRRGTLYALDEADRAIASYAAPDDRARVGGWIKAFLAGVGSGAR
jgi:GMP synthase-like glutamine amidotransferase